MEALTGETLHKFKKVLTFNMDEYVELPEDHPESYHTFMFPVIATNASLAGTSLAKLTYITITGLVDIDPRNVNVLNGNAPDLVGECNEYEVKIEGVGGMELFLGGTSEDGYVAFNEPRCSLSSRTRIKTLAYDTILPNARIFDNDIAAVPRMALMVGVKTVLESREALGLSTAIGHGANHLWTLSALQTHPWALIVVDDDATAGTGTCARQRGDFQSCASNGPNTSSLSNMYMKRSKLRREN